MVTLGRLSPYCNFREICVISPTDIGLKTDFHEENFSCITQIFFHWYVNDVVNNNYFFGKLKTLQILI